MNWMAENQNKEIPTTADIVIIGGGLAGTAALWAIEQAEPGTQTVLIEQNDHLGGGSSVASLESFRSCWGTEAIAQQMRRSIEVFLNSDDFLGDGTAQALSVRQHGYLFCAFNAEQAETLKADVEHLHRLGLTHVEYLDADEFNYRFPWLSDSVVAGKFDPIAGSLDSNALIHAYIRQAPNAQIIYNARDVQIQVEAGHVKGVSTSTGAISAPIVVIASGAGAFQVGRTAGIELPVVVRPRQSFTTPWRHEGFPEEGPMVIGAHPFPHVRPEARSGAIFGWEYHWNSKYADSGHDDIFNDALREPLYPVSQLKDMRFPSITLMLLAKQFGHADGEGFADMRYMRGIQHNIGYYVYRDASTAYVTDSLGNKQPYMSERAIIDAHPDVGGLFLSIAHGGHGIMTSPSAGEILASKVLGRELPHPLFTDFGIDVSWVEHDMNAL